MSDATPATQSESSGWFPQTHWSVILAAGDLSSPNNQQALAEFCESYRTPVYFFLRGHGHQPADADDLTQEFFTWFLQKEILAGLTREGSRFRHYLLTVIRNFLSNKRRDQQAQKRGGGVKHVPIDPDTESRCLALLSVQTPPETLFDREWARTTSSRAFSRLREEYKVAEKEKLFDHLRGCFLAPRDKGSYVEAADALNMTEEAVRQAAFRMRKRYQELLRLEIAAAGTSKEEIDEEIRYLIATLGRE